MSEAPATRRRWFQFGLSRMIVSVALAALAIVGFRTLFAKPPESFFAELFLLFGSSIASTEVIGVLARKEGAAVVVGALVGLAILAAFFLVFLHVGPI